MTKKTLIPSILLVLAAGCASNTDMPEATAGGSTEAIAGASDADPRVEHRLTRMQEHLDLSEEQVELLRPVLQNQHASREESRDAFRAEIEGILTREQFAELESHRRGMGRGHGPRGRRGAHGPRDPGEMLERMTEHLELSEEQVAALTPVIEGAHARHEELRDLPREERREAFRAIREETKVQVDEILTEEQRAKLEEHFERRGRRGRRHHRGHHGRGGDGHHRGGPADAPPAVDGDAGPV